MGVSCLLSIAAAGGRTSTQVLEDLQQRLDTLGAQKTGVWSVECQTYHATPNLVSTKNRTLNTMRSSEYPASCFALLDSGLCLTADKQLDAFLQQLQTFYASRKGSSNEAKGPRYRLGDFVIKPGIVCSGPNSLGTVLEVEFVPCQVAEQCWSILCQMIWRIVDPGQVPVPSSPVAQRGNLYTAADTMAQYLNVFSEYRKLPRQ